MNKTELITFLRDPKKLSSDDLEQLEEIVAQNPYFLSARLLLAKGSKELKDPKTKKRIASAAVYSTDRILLKKYLSSNLFFLSQPPPAEPEQPKVEKSTSAKEALPKESIEENKPKKTERISKETAQETTEKPKKETKKVQGVDPEEKTKPRKDKRPSALKPIERKPSPEVPEVPSGELDSILEELTKDMKNLKESREHFVEVQQKIEEDDAVSAALEKAAQKPIEEKEDDAKEIADITSKVDEVKVEITSEDEIEQKGEAKEELAVDSSTESKDTSEDEDAIIAKKLAEITSATKAKIEEDEKKTEDSTNVENDKAGNDDENTRAERTISEPRFSRFSTRSYLKDLSEENVPTELHKDEPLPERPVRGSKRRFVIPDDEAEKEPAKSSSSKTTKKAAAKTSAKKEVAAKKETTKKTTTTKKSTAKKESVKKEPAKKITETKKATTAKKTTASKKASTKTSASAKKSTGKTKDSEKSAAAKKTTTKKATTKKATSTAAAKKASTTKKATSTKKTATKKAATPKSSKTKTTKKKDDNDDGKGERERQKQIIDKFIEEAPSIKYQRSKDESSIDLAEGSSSWDPNMASEYLAQIYLHQGNNKRAIEIYEALILKYPEKKSYFADLISKIG